MTTEPVTRIICCLKVEQLCDLTHEPGHHTHLGALATACGPCQRNHLVRDQLGLFLVDLNCPACIAHAAHNSARGLLFCHCCHATVQLHPTPQPVLLRHPKRRH